MQQDDSQRTERQNRRTRRTSRHRGGQSHARRQKDSQQRAESQASRQPRADQPRGFSRQQKSFIMQMRMYGCVAFAGIMAIGLLVGLLVFARPDTSDVEKRELTKFPELSLSTFLDGEYFEEVSLWYSDTYPLREPLVASNKFIKTLFGFQPDTMMVGGNVASQEIPDPIPLDGDESLANTAQSYEPVAPPTEQAMQEEIQDQIMSGLYVKNGAAYTVYYFDQNSVDTYCRAITTAAERLSGIATVYSLLIPTNAYVLLDDQELSLLGGANQRQALDYFYGRMGGDVVIVDPFDALRDHNDEYIFFRTDHHWTQLGAYYAYEALCEQMDIDPVPLEGKEKMVFQPFVGSFYSELNVPAMAENPDYVDAYIPYGTNDLTYTDHDGIPGNEGHVVNDVTDWNQAALYSTFILGDQPYVEIHNPEITDGSSILIVKDSYADAFVPLVVDNFEDVYVVDFRYYGSSIVDLVEDNEIQNVVFLNSIQIAGTIGVANTMTALVSL